MSYPTHLINVNNRFYYKVKVPVDLQQYFPCTFIKKSLKTADLREAKTMLAAMEYNSHRRSTLQKLPANLYKKYPGKTIQQIVPNGDNGHP